MGDKNVKKIERNRDGVPCWDGDATTFTEYYELACLWEQSVPYHKRYLSAPKLINELTNTARRFVMAKEPDWVSYDGGVQVLLNHLRSSLGLPQMSEMSDYMAKCFRYSKRKRGKTMNEYITHKTELYARARASLARVQERYEPKRDTSSSSMSWSHNSWRRTPAASQAASVAPDPAASAASQAGDVEEPAEESDAPDERHEAAGEPDPWSNYGHWTNWQYQDWDYSGRGAWQNWNARDWSQGKTHSNFGTGYALTSATSPELLPDFVQGWFLLQDAGLDTSEKNMVMAALKNNFATQRVAQEVDTILANEALPVLQKVEKLFKTFSGSGFGYKQHVLPKGTLTHPSNRGGSMLNAADVWEKGHRMVKVGVQPSLLNEGAVAFELATEEGMRKRQLDANVALVKASGDTLAPVTFQERFLTVATSHTAAFCKAVEQGLKGPLGFPVDPKQDPGLQQLCSKGWPFLVLSNAVEVKWPQLPSYIQSALNPVNNSYQQMTEIEAASQMCEYLNHGMALKEALQKVQECDPACKRSLEAIAWFVSRYAGERQCLVKFLAHFSKTYGSLLLGEEMMKSIAYMEFKGSTSLYPFLRWASMMCSNRSSDGYSKLLNKSDCEKLKNAAFKAQVDMAEQALADGWEVIQKSTAEQATKLAAFGRLCTRLTLHVLKKEKHGREPAGHESINAICTLFAADLAGGAKPSVRKEEAKPTVELEVKNVLASTPAELALLQNPHMKQGQLYTCSKEHGNKIWTFLNSSASKVKFSHQPVFGPAESIEVEFEKLKDVAFSNHPNLVWSVKKVKKGALKLFPAGTVTKVKDTPVGGKHYIKAFGHHWLVQPFKALTDFKKGEGVLAPFWWVKSADNEGNMQLAEATVDGCKIPYLVNCTPLGPEEMLVLEKPENASSAKKQSKVKNPSLSSSVHLQKMLEDRNTAAMTFLNAQGQAAEPKENLFEESEEVEDKQPASKKRKCADAGDFTVEIQVQEQPVQVLLRGARPTRSDLLVRMEPDQLKAVLQLLEEEAADCLAADRKMDVDSLGKLLVEEIEKYKKAMGIAVKEEQDEDAVKDKTDKEITEMKKEPMEKRKLPMPTWQSKKPKNDDPKDSLAPPPPPPTTTRYIAGGQLKDLYEQVYSQLKWNNNVAELRSICPTVPDWDSDAQHEFDCDCSVCVDFYQEYARRMSIMLIAS
ncbi:unnamed protein product [Cladocopium goreaui]|uniref:Uncharacterized protein n=1 Tax=Cladocopium goreaui TaxID=2562237 RepID=A0A9P1GNX3_9DINO|nr:unnamed protein product [Cladocopium goreaui]